MRSLLVWVKTSLTWCNVLNLTFYIYFRLLSLRTGLVSMPGLYEIGSQDLVTIETFGEKVTVLPTKTKPKRITAIGSNGRQVGTLLFYTCSLNHITMC